MRAAKTRLDAAVNKLLLSCEPENSENCQKQMSPRQPVLRIRSNQGVLHPR